MTFNILNERNKFKNATCITIFKFKSKEYLLYIVNDYEDNDYNVMVSYIRKNNDGFHCLDDIIDPKEIEVLKTKFNFILGGEKSE